MEADTLVKIYENEIIANIKQKSLSPMEMAHLIDEYLKDQIGKGVKLVEIEQKLGITKRVLYKYRSILKVPKETIEKYKDKLSFEQMSVITYSVRDKTQIPDVMEEAVRQGIPSNELVYKVAEINDKKKIPQHIINELQRISLWVGGLREKIVKLPKSEQLTIREKIEDLVIKLNGV